MFPFQEQILDISRFIDSFYMITLWIMHMLIYYSHNIENIMSILIYYSHNIGIIKSSVRGKLEVN